jgi:hypothetical protein
MAIPADELLQEDFSFPVQGYDIEQIRQSIANRIPLLGSQRGVYGGGPMGGGFNLTGYTPQYSSMVGPIATGQAYAQQIAGGMPFSQVVAPGMSFSPERPQGYTQAELFLQDGAPIMPPPPGKTFVPFQGDMMPGETVEPLTPPPSAQIGVPPPMPTIFGFQAPQFPPIDLSQLPEIDLSQITIPESVKSSLGELLGIPKIDVSQFVTKEEIPSFIPPVQMPQIPQIDTSQFIGRQELPNILAGLPQAPQVDVSKFIGREELPSLLKDMPLNIPKIDTSQFISREDISGLRSDILGSLPQVQLPDVSKFVTQADINKALATIPPAEQLDRQALIRDIQSQIKVPERFDPTGLESQISGLQSQIQGIPQFDPTSLQARLGGLEQQLANIPQPQQIDIGALRQDILSSVPQTNLAGYITESQLQQALQGIPKPTMPDVSQFVTQADINRAISGIPQISLSDIEARLAALESTPSVGVPKLPRPTGLFA